MKFSKEYSKLSSNEFTTIRKRSRLYRRGTIVHIVTPTQKFDGRVIARLATYKHEITEEMALKDADCTRQELISMLEKWYGKSFDDFVLLKMRRIKSITDAGNKVK